jgi:hypothetical protein
MTHTQTESNEFYDEKNLFKTTLVSLLTKINQLENLVEINKAKLAEQLRLEIL